MNNDSFLYDTNTQFALSYELLYLLQWISKYEVDKLKKLIAKSIARGLHDEIQRFDIANNQHALQDMHNSMLDFFELADKLLSDEINQHVEKKAREKNLLPTIDHIDTSMFDDDTVRSSVEKTAKQLDHSPNVNATHAKEQLCKELLRQWKPLDKSWIN